MEKKTNPEGITKVRRFVYSDRQSAAARNKKIEKSKKDWPQYRVVGLMSGTSLDGVDLALVQLRPPNPPASPRWQWQIEAAETVPLPPGWRQWFEAVTGQTSTARTLVQRDVDFGQYLGEVVQIFLRKVGGIVPDFIASHGHTLFHQPLRQTDGGGFTYQLGHGGTLAAAAGLPVVSDFRAADVALGGQGAPLVPLGDRLLFPDYAACLNLGGIANISAERPDGGRLAYDICACNQLLNGLAAEAGLAYDDDGRLARAGQSIAALRAALDAPDFFRAPAPKSLGREWVEAEALPVLDHFREAPLADRLRTVVEHIAGQVGAAIRMALVAVPSGAGQRVLATGGGALNGFLIERLRVEVADVAEVVVPAREIIEFKEALIFALLGALRWRGEVNTLASATGARRDSSGGAIYAP